MTDWIPYFILIIFIVFIIVISILYSYNFFTPKKTSPSNTTEINTPSPWIGSEPVSGVEGICRTYTFLSNDNFVPVVTRYSDIQKCVDDKTCIPNTLQECIDPDQLNAQKIEHICSGNELTNLTQKNCLQQDGSIVGLGTIEKYYGTCEKKELCKGTLSLIYFNTTNNFKDAVCMSYSNSGMKKNKCSSTELYDNFPAQLFRIERAYFDGKNFVSNSNGQFARIIYRKNGYVLYPTSDYRLTFIKSSDYYLNQGYWWVLFQDIVYNDFKSPSQIVYSPDPTKVPSTSNTKEIVNYINNNDLYSISPEGDEIKIKKFVQNYKTMFIDYSLMPVILAYPQDFGFY